MRWTSAVTPDAALAAMIYAHRCVYSFHTLIRRAWSLHGCIRTTGVDARPTYQELQSRVSLRVAPGSVEALPNTMNPTRGVVQRLTYLCITLSTLDNYPVPLINVRLSFVLSTGLPMS